MEIQFTKMHGIGNDFVVIDERIKSYKLTPRDIEWIANRHFGLGCDQVVILKNATDATVEMQIFNPDGKPAGACGNATRCVALYLEKDSGTIKVGRRLLKFEKIGDLFAVDMGSAVLDSQQYLGGYKVNIGNEHLVLFRNSLENLQLEVEGAELENHPQFPGGINVSFAKIIGAHEIDLRVWERGAGATLGCGSAACAVSYAGYKLGLCGKILAVKLPGGDLKIEIMKDESVMMTGAAQRVFEGKFAR